MADTAPPQPPEPSPRAPDGPHHAVPCEGSACPCLQEGYMHGLAAITGALVNVVPPGSVVVLRGELLRQPVLEHLSAELARISGHHQFVLVDLPADTRLDVVHDPQAVANLLGLTRPEPPEPRLVDQVLGELDPDRRQGNPRGEPFMAGPMVVRLDHAPDPGRLD